MKNIVVDIDGVICQWDFPRLIKKYFGVPILPEWVWCHNVADALGLDSDRVREMLTAEVYAPPNLIPGAVETLRDFLAQDYYISVYTNRLESASVNGIEDWLSKYGIPFSQVVTKKEIPRYIWAVIDDYPSKLLEVDAQSTLVRKLILFEQPWNLKCKDIQNRFEWASTWKEVREIVNDSR